MEVTKAREVMEDPGPAPAGLDHLHHGSHVPLLRPTSLIRTEMANRTVALPQLPKAPAGNADTTGSSVKLGIPLP